MRHSGGALVALLAIGCGAAPSPVVVVESVEPLGIVAQPGIVGRDGGPSASLWGRSVWTFGDTVAATADAEGQTWHHNSYAAFDAATATLSTPADADGAPRYLVPPPTRRRRSIVPIAAIPVRRHRAARAGQCGRGSRCGTRRTGGRSSPMA
jgi:hypothetical protein